MLRWKARVTHRDPTFKATEESVSVRKEKTAVGSGQREKWNVSVSFLKLTLIPGMAQGGYASRFGVPVERVIDSASNVTLRDPDSLSQRQA
jgi:hypothetical protein